MKIKIDHIAKIEGHAGFVADIVKGQVFKARLTILEGARLIEGILRGRKYLEVSQICARICGVCPVVHNLTSLKALEKALNIETSQEVILLRKLLMLGQIINSHALHLFFFSLSDFFGIKDDLKLIKKYPQKTKEVIAIRDFGNQVIELIGGRSIHPLTPVVGGFTKLPEMKKLEKLGEKAKEVLPQAIKLAKFFAQLKYPELEREADFVSLISDTEYAIYEGEISINGFSQCHAELVSASLGGIPEMNSGQALKQVQNGKEEKFNNIADFMKKIQEFQVPEDAVKRTKLKEKPYMVGAIARINNNFKKLNPQAKRILKASKIKIPSQNPFHNILAQAIEIVHCVEEVTKIIVRATQCLSSKALRGRELFDITSQLRPAPVFSKLELGSAQRIVSSQGTAAIEAPRGTLFYYYEVGNDGLIKNCNIITPTAQNLARLEEDLKIWLPTLKNLSQKEIQDKIRMLVRAYDPCLTCATH